MQSTSPNSNTQNTSLSGGQIALIVIGIILFIIGGVNLNNLKSGHSLALYSIMPILGIVDVVGIIAFIAGIIAGGVLLFSGGKF